MCVCVCVCVCVRALSRVGHLLKKKKRLYNELNKKKLILL